MVYPLQPLQTIDYLVIGHITIDLTPQGPTLGGTASYASLTAKALGLRVGIVTSWGNEISISPLGSIPIISYPTPHSTTFENLITPQGRIQYVHHIAPELDLNLIPDPWKTPRIVHLAPIAQEVKPTIIRGFPSSLIGATAQGWLRTWDETGRVYPAEWPESAFVLSQVGATVISIEDIGGDEKRVEEMAASCHILAVTEAEKGSRVYWNGDVRHFNAPQIQCVDSVGAGDIYATAFFARLADIHDPWEAGRFATQIASLSITRQGIASAPLPDEIQECMIEVL